MPEPQVDISIRSHRNRNAKELDTLKDALNFFFKELFKRSKKEYSFSVSVVLKPNLTDSGITGFAGLAHGLDDGTYLIEVDIEQPFLEILSTLSHECVHIHQKVMGYLSGTDEWIWKGKNYGPAPYDNTDLDYKLPWEYDAYSKDSELAAKFVTKYYSNW